MISPSRVIQPVAVEGVAPVDDGSDPRALDQHVAVQQVAVNHMTLSGQPGSQLAQPGVRPGKALRIRWEPLQCGPPATTRAVSWPIASSAHPLRIELVERLPGGVLGDREIAVTGRAYLRDQGDWQHLGALLRHHLILAEVLDMITEPDHDGLFALLDLTAASFNVT